MSKLPETRLFEEGDLRMTVKPPCCQCAWKSSSKSEAIRKNGSRSTFSSFVRLGLPSVAVLDVAGLAEGEETGGACAERRRKSWRSRCE